MGNETIIVLKNGMRVRFTPIDLKFIDELEEFFAERGIPEKEIPLYLAALALRKRSRNLNAVMK